ncbi:MAG: nucleotidyltransferase family protein [Bacillota bacterium]
MNLKNVDKILVHMDDSIKAVMKTMDEGAMGIVLIVDDNKMLRGTVTDGDIRRAIINGKDLEQSVYNIMQVNFKYITQEQVNKNSVNRFFEEKLVRQLPVLNRFKQPIGIILLEDMFSLPEKNNYVVIMAGGLGSRLRPLTDEIPKPMLKVGSKPILETIIEQFKKSGFNNILISVNYKSNIIEDYFQDGSSFGVSIEYVKEKERLGTAGALRLARQYLESPFFVINGDILTNLNFNSFLDFHYEGNNDMTIATRSYNFQIPYGVINTNNDKIASLDEKPEMTFSINAGIYILNPSIIEYIPENIYYGMNDLINTTLQKQHIIGSYPLREYWIDIGHMQDYYKANEDINKYFGE